ncbi:hypothetical protein GLYMA_07G274150v4 [Glycine max]|nr:hypothetical protein GLYMA_07G274150v4 [Glycine max]KAH1088955.1 hypothetical protein GYH30_019763 [Glycine max]
MFTNQFHALLGTLCFVELLSMLFSRISPPSNYVDHPFVILFTFHLTLLQWHCT